MVFIAGALEGGCLNACERTIIITELFMQISKIHINIMVGMVVMIIMMTWYNYDGSYGGG